jgi:hypothetical protein
MFGWRLTTLHLKKAASYEVLDRASDLDGFFGLSQRGKKNRIFQNRLLRRMFGPESEEVAGV